MLTPSATSPRRGPSGGPIPVPAWALVAIEIGGALLLTTMAVSHAGPAAPAKLAVVCATLMALAASYMFVNARRIGQRGLLVQALGRIAVSVALAGAAPSAAATFVACGGFLWVGIWVAAFFPRRLLVATLLVESGAVVIATAINHHHLRTLADAGTMLFASTLIASLLSEVIGGLRRQARHDHLTGLLNRYGIDQAMSELERRRPRSGATSIVAIDLDGFKAVNDRAGHLAGDSMLIAFAAELAQSAPADCLLARVGGDEFVAVLPGLAESDARSWAASVRDRSAAAWSFGVAERKADEGLESWIARADRLMYAAKSARRGVVQLNSPALAL